MTRLTVTSAALAALLALGNGPAAVAQDGLVLPLSTDTFAPYGPFGGWNVFINQTRSTCFAERPTETSVLQMGITEPAIFAYLGVFTQAPTAAESGRVDSVELLIGERRFVGEVTEAAGNIPGGFSGGYIVSRDLGLMEALAGGTSMTATVGGRAPVVIDLTGTADAIAAVRACNAAQGG
jgi:hypothetical protein